MLVRTLVSCCLVGLLFLWPNSSSEAACQKITSVCSTLQNCITATSITKVKNEPVCMTGDDGFVPKTESCGAKTVLVVIPVPCGNSLAVTRCVGDPTQEGCPEECPDALHGTSFPEASTTTTGGAS